jgi:ferrous iron transport protein A
MSSLSTLQVGDCAKVIGYRAGDKAYRQKLLAMGLTRGVQFSIVRKAPLGDPIEICVRGFHLSLRKKEAHTLEVEQVAL